MEVNYRWSYEDFRAALNSRKLGTRVLVRFGTWIWLAACFTPPTLIVIFTGLWYALLVGVVLLVVVGVLAVRQVMRYWRGQRQLADRLAQVMSMVRISPEQLEFNSALSKNRVAWTELERVFRHRDYVVIDFEQNAVLAIPSAAFQSAEEAERFATLAAGFKQNQAKTRFPAGPTLLPTSNESVQISYSLTTAEFQSFQRGEVKAPQQSRVRVGQWFLYAMFIGAALTLISRPQPISAFSQVILGALVYIGMAIPITVLVNKLFYRLHAHQPNSSLLKPRTLTITPSGIHLSLPNAESFQEWTAIDGIELSNHFVAIYRGKPHLAHLIPRRVFPSEQDAVRFYERVSDYWEVSRDKGANATGGSFNSSNPYQPPSVI